MGENVLGPAPGGEALTFTIECRSHPKASRGQRHPVVIEADWTVATRHDLDAERVAAAFGGFTSCLGLVDRVIPAIRDSLGLLLRRARPELRRIHAGTGAVGERVQWLLAPGGTCRCGSGVFPDAGAAAAHLRSVNHIVNHYEACRWQVTRVLDAFEDAWGPFDRLPERHKESRNLVREPRGIETLWEAGLHPDEVARLATYAFNVAEPLPTSYYLGCFYSGVDMEWLAVTIARNPDPFAAAWLAWVTPEAVNGTDQVGAWRELGLARQQVLALCDLRVPVELALELAAKTHRTAREAGRDLAVWAAVGVTPDLQHFRALDAHGLGSHYRPSAAAVDRVCDLARQRGSRLSRVDLGVALAITGAVPEVEARLRAGARDLADLIAG